MDKMPKCKNDECMRKGTDLYVYTDGRFTIGICYACGGFDGTGCDAYVLEEFIYEPELILDLIKSGHLAAVN